MLKGEYIRTAVYIDRELLAQLKIALAVDQLTMSAWFRSQARVYVQSKANVDLLSLLNPKR